jgi:hypothetical protein
VPELALLALLALREQVLLVQVLLVQALVQALVQVLQGLALEALPVQVVPAQGGLRVVVVLVACFFPPFILFSPTSNLLQ